MTALIKHEDCDNAKVRAFGARLSVDPLLALALADTLFRGAPFTGIAAEIRRDFDRLKPWEQAGAVDELRDALDKALEQKFFERVLAAKEATAPAPVTAAMSG